MKRTLLIFALCVGLCGTVDAKSKKTPISENLFGIFFEDLNYAADGGLYGELIQNRSFEYSPSDVDKGRNPHNNWHYFTAWSMERDNSICTISLEGFDPVHPNNPHYLVFDALSVGPDGVGLSNDGYDGIPLKGGEKYYFTTYFNVLSGNDVPVDVMLVDGKMKDVLAKGELRLDGKGWKKYELDLTPSVASDSASLRIMFRKPSKIAIDMVSLFPSNTFRGHRNGLRADIAETIAALKPSFVRFPGGCLAHGDGLANIYNWKNTIGPVESRKSDKNIWNYHQSFGLGYFEYLQFCEDIGAKPIPVVASGVSCQNSSRTPGTGQEAIAMEDMPAYIQDVLDLIEYCNGPATSEWGSRRAEAGHPEPFNLEFIGIGNEDNITPEFEERFKMIVNAVKAKHPEIIIIGTSGPFANGFDFDKGWESARENEVGLVDEHYYCNPDWFLQNLQRYDSYSRKGPKVYLGEYASWGNTLFNAISEAAYMTSLERNGDVVEFASYAPLLARIGNTQWNPDMIYFDNKGVYPTVNYYVQKLFSENRGSTNIDGVFTGDCAPTSSCVVDGATGDIVLKMVNAQETPQNVNVNLKGLKGNWRSATLTELKGDRNDMNTRETPDKVKPESRTFEASSRFDYELPPMSLTVIRIPN